MDETEDLIVNHAMGALPISARPTTDIIGGFPEKSDNCKGCGKPLSLENAPLTDGCPCNSPLGINSMNETRWRLLMMHQQSQALQLAAAVAAKEKAERTRDDLGVMWRLACDIARKHCPVEWVESHIEQGIPRLAADRDRLAGENVKLREALATAGAPLEILALQILSSPYRELSAALQDQISRAVVAVRATLSQPAQGEAPADAKGGGA